MAQFFLQEWVSQTKWLSQRETDHTNQGDIAPREMKIGVELKPFFFSV